MKIIIHNLVKSSTKKIIILIRPERENNNNSFENERDYDFSHDSVVESFNRKINIKLKTKMQNFSVEQCPEELKNSKSPK